MVNVLNNNKIDFSSKINEDMELLEHLDSFFYKKRGKVVDIPPPGSHVLACMSGGLDSISNILILLEEFKLCVHPFFILRHQSNLIEEKKSVEYFDLYFKERYPEQYFVCKEIKIDTPSLSYKHLLTFDMRENGIGYPARNSIIFLTAAEFAYALKKNGYEIKTIFASMVAIADTSFHVSLSWIRVTNLAICQFFNDYSWQLISLPIEREFGNCYDKDVLITYCEEHAFPIHMTRSCISKTSVHCGECVCCYDRSVAFARANIEDKTVYLQKVPHIRPTY